MSENITNNEIESLQDSFNAIRKSLEKPTIGGTGSTEQKIKKEDLIKKYFTPQKDKEIFRALPPTKNNKRIEEAYFHVVWVNTPKGKQIKKVFCPEHNNPKVAQLDSTGMPVLDPEGKHIMISDPCPLCKKYKDILSTQTPLYVKKENYSEEDKKIADKNREIFKEASGWEAKKFYIIKGIDQGATKDGVKFWRFKHNFKKTGVFDKLSPVLFDFNEIYKEDWTSPENGCDLSITTAKQTIPGSSREYTEVTAIGSRGKSKLTEDPILLNEWLSDTLTWRDVFKMPSAPNISGYEYLEMVANGTQPYYNDTDSSNKYWVFPDRPDLQEKANTRTRDLGVDSHSQQAGFIQNANINTISQSQITPNTNQGVNLTQQVSNLAAASTQQVQPAPAALPDVADDLPF